MARSKHKKNNERDGTRFVAMPHIVLDSPAYMALSYSARALLVDIARQFAGNNNGKLVTCSKAMSPRGWNSHATITKAQKELVEAGFLCVTRQGAKPNKATWFALTWQALNWSPEMDMSRNGFSRGAYLQEKFRSPKNGV